MKVNIHEVCPRDGFQSMPTFDKDTKVNIINRLVKCGFHELEVTSFVSPRAVPQLKDADEVISEIDRSQPVTLRALVPNERGLERAHALGIKKLKLMLSGSDSHSLYNANATTFDALERYRSVVKKATTYNINMTGSIAVAFGCPYEGDLPVKRHEEICDKYEQLGITKVSLADTTGMGNPHNVSKILRHLMKSFPHFTFSIHLHNTRGMAFANALAALEEGVKDFDSSTGGIGGCPYAPNASGNIATEDLVHGFEEMGIDTGVNLDRVLDVARYLEDIFPDQVDSFLLKAGKAKSLHKAPGRQRIK